MKKIWKYFLLLLNASCYGQITLEHTLDSTQFSLGWGYGFKTVQISTTETKYYVNDTISNTFNLYNMDFTPFMTNIPVPEPFDITGASRQALYITRSLFDCDTSNIEYAYYSPGNAWRTFRVVRTDGTILFQRDSANGPYGYGNMLGGTDMIRPIVNTSSGAKLFLQSGAVREIYIYALCGSIPVDVFDYTPIDQSFVKVFPNPVSNVLTFQINHPDNNNELELVILSSQGQELTRERVNNLTSFYKINVSNFDDGVYYYSLCTKNKSYQSGKFILTK